MRPPFGGGESVTLTRRVPTGEYDDYGNVIMEDVDTVVAGVAIWPESATEVLQSVDRTNTVYIAMFPVEVNIDAIDALTWLGKAYEVQGEPERYQSPLTGSTLQTIRMSRVEG